MGRQDVALQSSIGTNLQNRTVFLELLRQVQSQFNQTQRENLHLADELDQLRKSLAFRIGNKVLKLFGGRKSRRFRATRLVLRTAHVLWEEGPRGVIYRARRRLRSFLVKRRLWNEAPPAAPLSAQKLYELWIERYEPNHAMLDQQRQTVFSTPPKISVIVATWNTPPEFLVPMIESVCAQTYPHWEMCIADGGSTNSQVRMLLQAYTLLEPRINVRFLDENRGIAGNQNAALEMARGDLVAFLDHDDLLAPFALHAVADTVDRHADADLIYSDEDHIDITGARRYDPFFKPAYSPDLLRSSNYICHLCVIRRRLLERLGGFRTGFEGSQDYDLFLRVCEQARTVIHIPQILYHWRAHPASTASSMSAKPDAYLAGERALREHLTRLGRRANVKPNPDYPGYEVRYDVPEQPLISVIIPNKDGIHLLDRCLRSLTRASYSNIEILLVENNSVQAETFAYYRQLEGDPKVRLLNWDKSFNYAAINNWAAAQARGSVLLLLNNDIESMHNDWLEPLLDHAHRPEAGVVGALLFYPNGLVQHAGVIMGIGGGAGHLLHAVPFNAIEGIQRQRWVQNYSAVTAACLMVRKSVFDEVGGLDERFAVAFNDVDFCLKVRSTGRWNVWTPLTRLTHHESVTRGQEDSPEKQRRFQGEVQLLLEKWGHIIEAGDEFYNPNLSLTQSNLAIDSGRARPPLARVARLSDSRTEVIRRAA